MQFFSILLIFQILTPVTRFVHVTRICSWCKYWALDKRDYKPKSCIPAWIKQLILPIIKDLQSDELLTKCLHGATQNANEALNGVIWSRIPKRILAGKATLEMATHSAVLCYNEGANGVLDVLAQFDICGTRTVVSASFRHKERIGQMKCKSSEQSKKQRKVENN